MSPSAAYTSASTPSSVTSIPSAAAISRVCGGGRGRESGEKRKTAQRDWIGSMIFDE